MTVHLLHGFNVRDGGRASIAQWTPHLDRYRLPWEVHDQGRKGLLGLRGRNAATVEWLRPLIQAGDILGGHSNAAWVAWELVQAGAPVAAVVVFQPALRRDTEWPPELPVLCVYNRRDLIVQFGRAWGRFSGVVTRRDHGWGAAGRYGFTAGQPLVENYRTDNHPRHPVRGHSRVFRHGSGLYHLDRAAQWAADHYHQQKEHAA